MDLRRDFSLKHLALLSWSASFWNRQSINSKVQRIIDNMKDRPESRNLISLAKDELKAMELPNVIYDELIQRIIWFGERVLQWYRWCRSIGVPWRCTREIHWTVFGTIDEAKTVEKNFLGPDVTLSSDLEIYGVYYIACTSAMKDYVNRNATKIIDFCRKHENEFEYGFRDVWLLYRFVLTLANPESLDLSNEEKNELISKYFRIIGCSKEAFMFEFSVIRGYTAAAEYYWLQLKPVEKEDKRMSEAMKYFQDDRTVIDIDVLVFVFLLSEMSKNQRKTFYSYLAGKHRTTKGLILRQFMESCAWEDLFFPVFYLLDDLEEHEKEYYYDLVNSIISVWKMRLIVGFDAKNHVYKQIFLTVWRRLKTFHSENQHFDSWFGRSVFQLFDIDVFKAVLKNYSYKQEFLELGKTHYKDLLMKNQFGLLKEFMGTVLISPGERAWFKNELISHLYDIIHEHKFYVADNLLNWLLDSKEERQKMKFKFDFLFRCAEHFVTNNLTSATELVTWGFSNEQERNQYIDGIVSSNLDWLHMIWSRNKNNFVTSLFDFLEIFFDTKEAHVGRKIAKLLTEDALRKFFMKMNELHWRNCSLTRKAFHTLDKLIEYCIPLENCPKLKINIAENAGKWLLYLVKKNFCWKVVDDFFNWVSGDEFECFDEEKTILDCEKKRELVQRFLLSSDGINFLEIMSSSNHPEKFVGYAFLLVKWAGGVGVIENYMNELEGLNLQDPDYSCNYAGLKNMLWSFKNGDVQYESLEHVCQLKVNSKPGRCKNSCVIF